jgi:hypothetical protein
MLTIILVMKQYTQGNMGTPRSVGLHKGYTCGIVREVRRAPSRTTPMPLPDTSFLPPRVVRLESPCEGHRIAAEKITMDAHV